ncbi:MAG: ATP-dependent Clp protease adaptor ClpS [Phycisphaerales bacterium]|nr:ATP-dependent Clp protease adaptor ClpS [Phycisphaerales bacterium]
MATAAPQARPETDTGTPVPWNVVLLNDESHTYEYVIRMVQKLSEFGGDETD